VRPGHNAGMTPEYDFRLALTRVIEPTSGPGIELATLGDAARFIALMKPFRQTRPHWDFAQMERALRVEGWL
jgi:hypothetical protein